MNHLQIYIPTELQFDFQDAGISFYYDTERNDFFCQVDPRLARRVNKAHEQFCDSYFMQQLIQKVRPLEFEKRIKSNNMMVPKFSTSVLFMAGLENDINKNAVEEGYVLFFFQKKLTYGSGSKEAVSWFLKRGRRKTEDKAFHDFTKRIANASSDAAIIALDGISRSGPKCAIFGTISREVNMVLFRELAKEDNKGNEELNTGNGASLAESSDIEIDYSNKESVMEDKTESKMETEVTVSVPNQMERELDDMEEMGISSESQGTDVNNNTEAAFAQQECEEEEPEMVCQTEQLAKECW